MIGTDQLPESRHGRSPAIETLLPAPVIMPTVAAILLTFTQLGDGVIVQSPVNSPYFEVVRRNGRHFLVNRLLLSGSSYELDLEYFERLARDGARAGEAIGLIEAFQNDLGLVPREDGCIAFISQGRDRPGILASDAV